MLLSDAFRIGGLMPAASLETTLELWSTTLRQAKHRIRPLFAAPSVAASAHAFLDGLLGAERRKTGWMGAEGAGLPVPWSMQEIRRVAIRLAQRRIEPAFIIAWSAWRRAHQAAAQQAHFKRRLLQL